MDAVKSTKYSCCGDCTFDVVEALGKGPVSNCAAHEHWRKEGFKKNPRPPWPIVVDRRMRIVCVWCGAGQVVKLVPQFFEGRYQSGPYAGMLPSEADREYVESCARHHHNEHHMRISKEFLENGRTNKPSVPTAGDLLPGGGIDTQADSGKTERVYDGGEASGGVLGLAEKAASLGWRQICRVGADASRD